MYRTKKNSHGRYNLYNDLNKIKAALSDVTKHAGGNASKVIYDQYDSIVDKTAGMQDSVISYTKKKPLKTIGIAVLAGLAIGFLIRK